jgi:uncharacterized protein YrrD
MRENNMWTDELKDKPVVSIAEGTKVGSVHDVYLDESCTQVVALLVSGGGLLGGHKQAVMYSAVRGMGPDAVMVEGRDSVQDVSDDGPLGAALHWSDLHQEMMTEGGVHLGRVGELEFDPQSGSVTALELDPKGDWAAKDGGTIAIERADIVNLTPKLAIVRHDVIDRAAPEEHRPSREVGQVVRRSQSEGESATPAREEAATSRTEGESVLQSDGRVPAEERAT